MAMKLILMVVLGLLGALWAWVYQYVGVHLGPLHTGMYLFFSIVAAAGCGCAYAKKAGARQETREG